MKRLNTWLQTQKQGKHIISLTICPAIRNFPVELFILDTLVRQSIISLSNKHHYWGMILGISIDNSWEKGQYLCKMSHVFSAIIKSFLANNDKKNVFGFPFMKKSISLRLKSVLKRIFFVKIKRESGENPGQSRCCEAPITSWNTSLPLAFAGKASRWESVRRPAISYLSPLFEG